MRIIFAHDHRFYLDQDGNAFSQGKIKREMFDLYLNYSDSITIVSRFRDFYSASVKHNLNKINDEKVNFIPFKDLSHPMELLKNNMEIMSSIVKNYDFVIARLPSEIGLLAIAAAKMNGIKYAIEFVACPWDALWNYGSIQAKLYAPLFFLRNRLAVRGCQRVAYVTSRFLQDRYPTLGNAYGISDVEIDIKSKHHTVKKIDLNAKIKIALIGSLDSPHKGIDDAIKAIRVLNDRGCNVELNILGPGDKGKWLGFCEGIEHIINFVGVKRTGAEVQDWLSTQDIYIQPSLQEGLPRAIVEAMNCGLPVIGSNAGGIPELVNKNYIHRRRDYISLSKNIFNALEPCEYDMLSRYSLEKAKKYDLSKLHKKRIEMWKDILCSVN